MSWIPSYKKPAGSEPTPPMPEIVTWSSGTDEEIAAMLEAHYAGVIDIHDYWAVGDTRTISLSAMSATYVDDSQEAQDVNFVLSHAGGKILSDGTTECAFQVDQVKCLNDTGYINSTNTNIGSWKSCARRTWCNSIYYNAIPSTLRDIFKEFINQSGLGGGSSSGVENTTDYFALRAEVEVCGTTTRSVSGEGSQVTWYETSANRIKQRRSFNDIWWGRSPYKSNAYLFISIDKNGISSQESPDNYRGIAPFGCI